VLARLAIFVGEFTMDAAIDLGSGPTTSAPTDLVDTITGLIEKSLVATDLSGNVVHYRLLNTTRIYALEKLGSSGEADAMARHHAAYFCSLARQAETEWETLPAFQWLSIFGRSVEDMRAALDWAFAASGDLAIGLDTIIATAPLWFQLSMMDEYRERLLRALAVVIDSPTGDLAREVRLRIALGHSIWYSTNNTERMHDAFTRALEIAETTGDAPHS
jgi:predicted ATPase